MGLRQRFISSFREFFLYHYTSLEFRAKILTFAISANPTYTECSKEFLKTISLKIYAKEPNRAEALIHTTDEYLLKLYEDNHLDSDWMLKDIIIELKRHKRYANKIDIVSLKEFENCIEDEDSKIYFERVLEFLDNLKKETLS